MVTETAVGGMVSPGAVPLADANAVHNFSAQFEDDRMETRLLAARRRPGRARRQGDVRRGRGARLRRAARRSGHQHRHRHRDQAKKSITKPVECLAPMTSVAVVLVDESVVG